MDEIKNLNINTHVHTMVSPVNYVLIPFEGNTNTGDPQGLNIYLQAAKDMHKKPKNLDMSVSNELFYGSLYQSS